MKLEAIGKQYEDTFFNETLCDTFENITCWLNKCTACCNAKKIVPMLELATITNYGQGEMFPLKCEIKLRVKMNFKQN